MGVIRKAVKSRPNLRVLWSGPSKSGKTGAMLSVMTGHNPWTDDKDGPPLVEGRIGVIDAEDNGDGAGTTELYADLFDFDIIVLKRTHADYYTEAIQEFAKAGCKGLIIDGISPEWADPTYGCLTVVKNIAKTKYNGDTHRAWQDVNVFHNRLIRGDAGATLTNNKKFGIKNYPGHVFVSVQAKTKYERITNEDKTGYKKTVIEKLGMGPIQRAEIDYEFDTCFNLDHAKIIVHGDTRVHTLQGKTFENPGPELTKFFLEWLGDE
jgi:hypothetical protein